MMTPAELFRELLKPDGKPDRQIRQYEALQIIFQNPIDAYLMGNRRPGTTSVDRWGTTILFPEDAPGAMPHITEDNKVCPDITHWREYCHAPDLLTNCSEGWDKTRQIAAHVREKGALATMLMGTGIFEQCHFLMGFEDTLTAFYEHPQEMHELIDYICAYRLGYVKLLIDEVQPDAILSHDDWGTKDALFMQPDIWREFFKEPYRRFYGYIRSRGVIAAHHADSYLVPIIEDMVEIGIQCWQGVLPENNIPQLQEQLQGRMILMGGVGAAIDRSDAGEADIRAYMKQVLAQNCPRGHYIPCITYGAPGTVYAHVDKIIDDEITRYNETLHTPEFRPAAPTRRVPVNAPVIQKAATSSVDEPSSVLPQLSMAVQRGKRKQTLTLCQKALDRKIPAQRILDEALVAGMMQIGADFSAGKVFVPEMLMAARCMTAATDLLKPFLVETAASKIGRVCIGTVKGDMHDIGKNLVKIMLEGSGLEVIDLGCDVAPEVFVRTAKEQHCDIIALSALLTTTMNEMRNVVELTEAAGIRDQVIIMVGGAPVTQEFCDAIGADIYTDDAGAAAKAAVQALSARH